MLLRRKDGSEVPVEVNAIRYADGSIYGAFRDITLRRQAAERIRQLSMAVEQSPECIVITDLDARIEYVNEAFVRNTGYSRDEVIGRTPDLLQSGNTPRQTFVELWAALRAGKPWKGELYNRRKDGSEYVDFAHIAPIRQPDGRISHYLSLQEDISEKNSWGGNGPLSSSPGRHGGDAHRRGARHQRQTADHPVRDGQRGHRHSLAGSGQRAADLRQPLRGGTAGLRRGRHAAPACRTSTPSSRRKPMPT